MNQRMAGDASLNAPIKATDGENGQWQDWLVDESDSQEKMLIEEDEREQRSAFLHDAMNVLNDRERRIFEARRLVRGSPDARGSCPANSTSPASACPPDRGARLRKGPGSGQGRRRWSRPRRCARSPDRRLTEKRLKNA